MREAGKVMGVGEKFPYPPRNNDEQLLQMAGVYATNALPLKAQPIAHELPGGFSGRPGRRQSSVPKHERGTGECSRRSHRRAPGTRRCPRPRSRNRAQADQLDESEIHQQPRQARRVGRGNSHRTRTQTSQTKATSVCGKSNPAAVESVGV